ncbi:MAG: hypothetical protein JNL70_15525 [Saprospiraceae bacterium]|nr:hypothetical protein [Saprospiraceae bacterium]
MIKEGIGQVYIPQMILSTTSQIQINQGVLGLGSGSQTILKGAITVAANAFLGFDAFASLASGTSIVGQGSCYIVGTITLDNTITFNIANIDLWAGTLTLNKDITLSKLNMGGGVISGSGKLTITGDFHFQGGEIRNQTIANGNTYIEGANNSLYDGTINNGRGIANGGELTLNGSITYSYDNRFSIQGNLHKRLYRSA